MSEICFKVGDSGGYRDGDVIAVQPDGWLIPPVEMARYLADGTEPAVLAAMPKYQADRVRRRVLAIRWKLSHTDVEIEKEYNLPKGAGADERSMAQADVAEFSANGLDTAWGTQDLKSHGIVRVVNLTAHEIIELTDRDATVDHVGKTLGKVRYKVDYAAALSAAKVTALRDKTLRVDVDRVSAALPKTVAVAAPRDAKAVEK